MSDWAQDKAREWFKRHQQDLSGYSYALSHNDWMEISLEEVDSLAALLREVALSEQGSACADRAETVEQTHARWSAKPKEVKPEPFSDAACGPRYAVKSEHG